MNRIDKEALSQGLMKGLHKQLGDNAYKVCPACGMPIPPYPGRYPRYCPNCGAELERPPELESIQVVAIADNMYRILDSKGDIKKVSAAEMELIIEKQVISKVPITLKDLEMVMELKVLKI